MIIEFPNRRVRKPGDKPIGHDVVGDKFCPHEFVDVQRGRRRVVCRAKGCGAVLEAFDVLLQLARDWDSVTHCEIELGQLRKEVEALKAEKAKLRGYVLEKRKRFCLRCEGAGKDPEHPRIRCMACVGGGL